MNEIEKRFYESKEQGSGVLVGYVTGGDPNIKYTSKIAGALIEGGVDILELGIPFSDPIADGPSIQTASERALKGGTTPKMVLEIAQEIKRDHDVPIVILTYYNPIFKMGLDNFFRTARNCRVAGLIVPDLPVDEADDYKRISKVYNIDTVFFAAPSTSINRLQRIVKYSSGFLYLLALFGVTGEREIVKNLTIKSIKRVLPYTTNKVPLAVGFGISKPEHVKAVITGGANGVIIGSTFVNIINKYQGNLEKMLNELKEKAFILKKSAIRHL